MPHNFTTSTADGTYTQAGALTAAQSMESLWLAFFLVVLGLVFMEERMIRKIATAPARIFGRRAAAASGLIVNR